MDIISRFQTLQDLIVLRGDFPIQYAPVERDGNRLFCRSELWEVTAEFCPHASGVNRRVDTVKNIADRPLTLYTAFSRFLLYAGEKEVYTQFTYNNDESQGGWQPLQTEIAASSRQARCAAGAPAFAAIWEQQTSRALVLHLEDPCQWAIRIQRQVYGRLRNLFVSADLGLDNTDLAITLQPGESMNLPAILFYTAKNRTDLDAWKLHRYCNEVYPCKKMPVIYNTWMSFFDDISYDKLVSQLPRAKALGVEYFVIDAGWFGPPHTWSGSVGDWEEATETGMAGRMKEFSDKVREAGMEFGLWFEVERATARSKAFAEHPEYYIVQTNFTGNPQVFLDFSNPEAREAAFRILERQIEHYGIRYLKLDYNDRLIYDRHQKAFLPYEEGYSLFIRRIRERFPGIYLEGCASGGMRLSASSLRWFDSFWLSDNQNLMDQTEIYKNTLLRMPSRSLVKWVTLQSLDHPGAEYDRGFGERHLTADGLWFYMETITKGWIRNASLGAPIGISCDLCHWSEELTEIMAETVAQFKEERQFWAESECRILCDTPTMLILQYSDADFRKLKVQIFYRRVKQGDVAFYPVCDPNGVYLLPDGTKRTGEDLMEIGMEMLLKTTERSVALELIKE